MPLTAEIIVPLLQLVSAVVILSLGFFGSRYLSERIGMERYNRARTLALDVVKQVEQEFRTNKVAKDERHKRAYLLILRACPWLNAAEIDSLVLASLVSLKLALGDWSARAARPSDSPLPQVLPAPPPTAASTTAPPLAAPHAAPVPARKRSIRGITSD